LLVIEVRRDVAGLLAAIELAMEGFDDFALDRRTAGGVDGGGGCGAGFQSSALVAVAGQVARRAAFVESAAAVVAEAGAQAVLFTGARAMVAQLARRHGEEKPVRAFDEFDVSDDEGVVEGERAERFETTG